MKRIILICTVFLALTVLGGSSAMADWSFYLDNSGSDNIFEIWFHTDSSVLLDNYQLNFKFDPGEMEYATYKSTPPPPLKELFGTPRIDGPGDLRNFTSAFLFGKTPTVSNNIRLGTLTFNILPGAVLDGKKDLWFASTPGFGVTLDGYFYNYKKFKDPAFAAQHLSYGSGLDVVGSPVPVPAAAWLLGSGLLGLLGVRRFKMVGS